MKRVAFRAGLICALMLTLWVCRMAQSVTAQGELSLPLAEAGPYASGYMLAEYPDAARRDLEVRLLILYPAVQGTGAQERRNAEPDRCGAPYPLILTGYNDASIVNWQLAEHGFVLAAIRDALLLRDYNNDLVDFPRDLVFALEELATNPPEALAGLIGTDHTGVLGYSWDGYGALSVSGARIDSAYYRSQCGDHSLEDLGYPPAWNDYACALADDWDAFAAHAAPALTASSGDLWLPITDARGRAVAPLAPEGTLIFGPRGLAAMDRSTLIMIGTEGDRGQVVEVLSIFDYLGAADKTMISFIGQNHMAMDYVGSGLCVHVPLCDRIFRLSPTGAGSVCRSLQPDIRRALRRSGVGALYRSLIRFLPQGGRRIHRCFTVCSQSVEKEA